MFVFCFYQNIFANFSWKNLKKTLFIFVLSQVRTSTNKLVNQATPPFFVMFEARCNQVELRQGTQTGPYSGPYDLETILESVLVLLVHIGPYT